MKKISELATCCLVVSVLMNPPQETEKLKGVPLHHACTNESAFVETKRKLVDECDLWTIVSLPGGVFTTAGAGVKTNLLFFTKGRTTEKIWYYDLAHVKVGKKSPMTLAHFGFSKTGDILDDDQLPTDLIKEWREDEKNKGKAFPTFARLLSVRGTHEGESRYSWTMDFTARRAKAREEMQPHLDEAEGIKAQVVTLKERLKARKKAGAAKLVINQLEHRIKTQEKMAREALTKANAIDAAVFDLKAVNPNAAARPDTRTPKDIIANIEEQGRIVTAALIKLKSLLSEPD